MDLNLMFPLLVSVRWNRPHGRAFDLVMCELRRRLLGPNRKIALDTDKCTLTCGDERVVDLINGPPNSVGM